MINTVKPPAAAEIVVFMHTVWIKTELAPVAPRADPPLKPYHPNQSMNVPNTTRPTLWGLNSSLSVSGSKRPMRGPKKIAPYKPEIPPVMCTIPDPAKSVNPSSLTQPPDAQVQCTTTGYINPIRQILTSTYPPRKQRSDTAPETMVAVAPENAHWNSQSRP